MNRRSVLSLAGVAAVGVSKPALAATSSSTIKANTEVAKNFAANVLSAGNANALDSMVDPNIAASNPGEAAGADAYKARIASWLQFIGFSAKNPKFSAETIVAQGNDVIVRGHITGSSSSGKAINSTYFVQLTVKSGKIVGSWYAYDSNSLMGL